MRILYRYLISRLLPSGAHLLSVTHLSASYDLSILYFYRYYRAQLRKKRFPLEVSDYVIVGFNTVRAIILKAQSDSRQWAPRWHCRVS